MKISTHSYMAKLSLVFVCFPCIKQNLYLLERKQLMLISQFREDNLIDSFIMILTLQYYIYCKYKKKLAICRPHIHEILHVIFFFHQTQLM